MRCTDKELQALAQLRDDRHFEIFTDWIYSWLEEEVQECITAERPAVNQGRAQVLKDIVEAVTKSRENIESRISKRALRKSNPETAF